MVIDPHDLLHEFPQHREKIAALRQRDAHFQRLQADYEGVNKAIVQIEEGVRAADDAHLEELKKQRLLLKDQIAALLSA